ncbi:MAG: fumarylacetoacetate hydrolase family protein [Gammaproteobacteria bacterium]|nr:fumarylacetoacetate hydrolase family protein [Gammaproteobacteria bacterium]MCH9763270.1 fumarylacetoacetate hydrolase family protein [Gammaproteobacteria bacterium]
MKFATLKSNTSRDGRLCIVSRDLSRAVDATAIAGTLQDALEHWDTVFEALEKMSSELNAGKLQAESFAFDPNACSSPLPRAYQWADGSAYVNHVELVRKARNAEIPSNFWTDPLLYQGGSDTFLGPCDPISVRDEAFGIDFEAEIAIITDDVPMGIQSKNASPHIRMLMLVNDVSLRNLIPAEIGKSFGFFQSKPSSAFSPVAITPDELGSSWDGERLHLPLYSYLNNELFGKPNAGIDMTFSFPDLIAHTAKTRHLGAGTIIGSGTVSNTDRSQGSSCIAEKRMLEIIANGKPEQAFMHFGDSIRIEMLDNAGNNLFGSINQTVSEYTPEK